MLSFSEATKGFFLKSLLKKSLAKFFQKAGLISSIVLCLVANTTLVSMSRPFRQQRRRLKENQHLRLQPRRPSKPFQIILCLNSISRRPMRTSLKFAINAMLVSLFSMYICMYVCIVILYVLYQNSVKARKKFPKSLFDAL